MEIWPNRLSAANLTESFGGRSWENLYNRPDILGAGLLLRSSRYYPSNPWKKDTFVVRVSSTLWIRPVLIFFHITCSRHLSYKSIKPLGNLFGYHTDPMAHLRSLRSALILRVASKALMESWATFRQGFDGSSLERPESLLKMMHREGKTNEYKWYMIWLHKTTIRSFHWSISYWNHSIACINIIWINLRYYLIPLWIQGVHWCPPIL